MTMISAPVASLASTLLDHVIPEWVLIPEAERTATFCCPGVDHDEKGTNPDRVVRFCRPA